VIKIKKILITIILILAILPTSVFADHQVDMSNQILENGYIRDTPLMVIDRPVNRIAERTVKSAIRRINYKIPVDFTVHVVDGWMYQLMALGLYLPDNTIVIFDFLDVDLDYLVHDTVTHEIGHLIFNQLNECEVEEYKRIRGIPKEWSMESEYANRPTEIFAEDFRLLFGGRKATRFSHMNKELRDPTRVRGLERFIRQFEGGD
jgi:hypothetical protein